MVSMFSVFAAGAKDDSSKVLTILNGGDTKVGDTTVTAEVIKMLQKDFPGVKVEKYSVDMTGGGTLTIDSMIAAGNPPNVYYDSMVRMGKFMVPEYALPLNSYIRDLDKYSESTLSPYTINGDLLALPMQGGVQGMWVNLDIMKEIGYTVKPDWSVDDFLKMCELVKNKYNGERFGTSFFAANQSGDYLINNWFASFGVPFYEDRNYDKPIMADKGGAKVYAFYQTLMKNGYISKDAATLSDDDMIIQWYSGKLATAGFFPGWTKDYYKTAIDQGIIAKEPNYTFVPFPRAPGIKKVPSYANIAVVVVHKTGTTIDKVAARYAEYVNSPQIQAMFTKVIDVSSNRSDGILEPVNFHNSETANIAKENGLMDVGIVDSRFPERRAIQFPILQKLLAFKISPEDAIVEYQNKMAAVTK